MRRPDVRAAWSRVPRRHSIARHAAAERARAPPVPRSGDRDRPRRSGGSTHSARSARCARTRAPAARSRWTAPVAAAVRAAPRSRAPAVRAPDCDRSGSGRRRRYPRRRPAARAPPRSHPPRSSGSSSPPSGPMRPRTSRTSARGTSGSGRREFEPHRMRDRQALQFEHVAKAGGGDQTDARAAPLDQRIGRDRAAVRVVHALPGRGVRVRARRTVHRPRPGCSARAATACWGP